MLMPESEFKQKVELINGTFDEREGLEFWNKLNGLESFTGDIVEIGSFNGRSTSWLAYWAKKHSTYIINIDPFTGDKYINDGSLDHLGWSQPIGEAGGDSYRQFRINLTNMDLFDSVITITTYSERAINILSNPIKFLFIDGDHRYSGVKTDFALYSKLVVPNGTIAFHDTGMEPVERVIREAENEGFCLTGTTLGTTFMNKVK